MFSPEELERYGRHLVIREIGGPGQQKLKNAHVLVIGAGGLGSPLLLYLAAAGIGKITVVDDDAVSLSNLQRQVLHRTESVGIPKVESAKTSVAALNPFTEVLPVEGRFTGDNAGKLLETVTIAADCSDNFDTRYAAADACAEARIPLVTAAVSVFDGSLTVLKPYETRADGSAFPAYRDLFPAAPPAGTVPSCAEAGVLGALTGLLGTLQAIEIIKEICGVGETLAGKLLLVDSLDMRFDTIEF